MRSYLYLEQSGERNYQAAHGGKLGGLPTHRYYTRDSLSQCYAKRDATGGRRKIESII